MYQRSHPTQRHSHHTSKMNRGAEHLLSISQRSDFSDLSDLTCQNCQECKATIKSLQKNLEMRDEELAKTIEQIVGLEEKIVQMSLELASSKAFEDEHRAKRRSSCSDAVDDGQWNVPPLLKKTTSAQSVPAKAVKRRSWWGSEENNSSTTTNYTWALDESSSSSLMRTLNLGQFFRRPSNPSHNSLASLKENGDEIENGGSDSRPRRPYP